MKPKLIYLIRKFGLFWGVITYIECRRYHRWECINPYPADQSGYDAEGNFRSTGIVKIRCSNCHAIKLERLFVLVRHGQPPVVTTASGATVRIIEGNDDE